MSQREIWGSHKGRQREPAPPVSSSSPAAGSSSNLPRATREQILAYRGTCDVLVDASEAIVVRWSLFGITDYWRPAAGDAARWEHWKTEYCEWPRAQER